MSDITTAASVVTVTTQGPQGAGYEDSISASFASVSASAGSRTVGKAVFVDPSISEAGFYTYILGGAMNMFGGSITLNSGNVITGAGGIKRYGDTDTGLQFGSAGVVKLVSQNTDRITVEETKILVNSLPTSDPSNSGELFTQTAAQLGGSGTTKVICISAG